MRRQRIDLEDVANMDNLVLATWKAARAKRQRPSVARFVADLLPRLHTLAASILEEQAPAGRVRRFIIHDPKRRTITAACIEDRVLHHAILNLAEPRFEQMLTPGCYACRPGKGVHAAVAAVQQATRRSNQWPWVVQVDVDSYFPSIDHEVLRELLATRFKGAGFLALLGRIIACGASGPARRGLPIGALTSQHFANAYLDGADRLLLAHPEAHSPIRYMDDMVWWCRSRAGARETLDALVQYLWKERRLKLKPNVHVGSGRAGVSYCGFRVRPGVVLPSSRKLPRYRAGYRRLTAALNAGAISAQEAQRVFDTLLATMTGTVSLHFRNSLTECGYDAGPGCESTER